MFLFSVVVFLMDRDISNSNWLGSYLDLQNHANYPISQAHSSHNYVAVNWRWKRSQALSEMTEHGVKVKTVFIMIHIDKYLKTICDMFQWTNSDTEH